MKEPVFHSYLSEEAIAWLLKTGLLMAIEKRAMPCEKGA